MKVTSRSYDFLWLGIALFPLLIIVVLLPVQPHDYWWYLRLGKDVLQSGAVPAVDTYSSIQAGQPIVYQSWLSAVFLWLAYKTGAIPLTVLLVAALLGITYAMLWLLMREGGVGPRLAALLTLLAGLSGSNNWGVRPQLFAYPLFLAVLWILLKWQKQSVESSRFVGGLAPDRTIAPFKAKGKPLWLLIPLSWAWANLHGSFILFFILVGIAFVFGTGDRKKLFWVVLASLVVTLLNPRGLILWQSVIGTFTAPGIRDLSPEWLPPLNQGWQMNIFFAWLILLAPLAAFARRRLSAFEWILFLAFSWFALTGIRYVIWDLFIISVLTAFLMPEFIVKKFDQSQDAKIPSLNFALGVLFLLMPLMLLPGIRESWWKQSPPALDPQTPVVAADWLNQHPELPSPMWNDVVFGSYLIHATPSRSVWIDTRIQVIYTAKQAEDYLFVQSAQPGWDAKLKDEGVNLLFLASTQPSLVNAVQNSNEWCEQYQDKVAFIFSRCKPLP
jgi:hypothetical protein